MCAIFSSASLSKYEILYDANISRGNFASGILCLEGYNNQQTIKKQGSFNFDEIKLDDKCDYYIGHVQAPTSANRKWHHGTSHPFESLSWSVVHNGVLTNWEALRAKHIDWKVNPVDTAVIPNLLQYVTEQCKGECPGHEIDVDGRSIDIVFTAASKLGRIIQKMGIDTVERNIAHDLKKYGGAGVVIHEPDADSSKDLIGFLRKSAPEDEEMEDYEEEYSTDEAEETTGGKDNAFEEFVKAYRKVNPSPIDSAYDSAYLKTLEKTLNESSNGGRPLNINSTSKYLTEQLRRDSCRNITQKKTVSFREKYNPKTQWHLEELRRYGM